MKKKYIKLLLVILVAIFVGNINVYAFDGNQQYGVHCKYKNFYIELSSYGKSIDHIEWESDSEDLESYIQITWDKYATHGKETSPYYESSNTLAWLQEMGFVDSSGDFTCPTKLGNVNLGNATPLCHIDENQKQTCHYADIKDDFKNWTCNYKSSIGNKTMSIKYIEDTEYIHGRYIITYPDGTTNYLANPNGSGKLYSENGHEYISSNGNLLETDGTCDDIYYVNDGSRKIMTSLGESGATNNITLSGLCDQHETEEIIHFCNNGNCQMRDMICPKNSTANDVLNKTMANVIKFIKKVVFNTLQIFVPILLIIMGAIDLVKAMLAGNDKVYKDAFTKFVHKCLAAIIVFFITTIVTVVMGAVAKSGANDTNSWKYYWNKS